MGRALVGVVARLSPRTATITGAPEGQAPDLAGRRVARSGTLTLGTDKSGIGWAKPVPSVLTVTCVKRILRAETYQPSPGHQEFIRGSLIGSLPRSAAVVKTGSIFWLGH